MDFTPRVAIHNVTFGRGQVDVRVQRQYVDKDGNTFDGGGIEMIQKQEKDLPPDWTNSDIEAVVRAHEVPDKPYIPARAEIPAFPDPANPDGPPLREAIPAFAGQDATLKKAYQDDVEIVWL